MDGIEVHLKGKDFVEPEEDIYYLVAKEGVFLIKKNEFFESSVKVDNNLPLRSHQQNVKLGIPNIPYESIIRPVVSFFRKIYQTQGTEAEALLFYSLIKREYKIEVPKQKASGGGADYRVDIAKYLEKRKDGYRLIGDIHSHASMGAFHSGVDDHDEETFDGIHITVGNLDTAPTLSCSVVISGKRIKLEPDEIISGVEEFPQEWMKKVKKAGFSPAAAGKVKRYLGLNDTNKGSSRLIKEKDSPGLRRGEFWGR